MQIGEQVHYHLNAAARECPDAENGKAVLARILGVTAAGFHITVEGPEPLIKAGVQAGDGPGCISPAPPPEATAAEPANAPARSEALDEELGQTTSDDTSDESGGRKRSRR